MSTTKSNVDQTKLKDEINLLNENLKTMRAALKARDEASMMLFGRNYDTVLDILDKSDRLKSDEDQAKLNIYEKIAKAYDIDTVEKMAELAEVLVEDRSKTYNNSKIDENRRNRENRDSHGNVQYRTISTITKNVE